MRMQSVQSRMTGNRVQDEQHALAYERAEIEAAKLSARAFQPLYERYYRTILGFVYHRVDSKETAFDITSEVFLSAMNSLNNYKDQGYPFSSWLFRIALNILGKHYRTGKTRRTISLTDSGVILLQEDERSEFGDLELQQALETFPEQELQLVEMRYFEQRPYSEIASILEITESAAKQRMYKILEILKERITMKDQ